MPPAYKLPPLCHEGDVRKYPAEMRGADTAHVPPGCKKRRGPGVKDEADAFWDSWGMPPGHKDTSMPRSASRLHVLCAIKLIKTSIYKAFYFFPLFSGGFAVKLLRTSVPLLIAPGLTQHFAFPMSFFFYFVGNRPKKSGLKMCSEALGRQVHALG